MAENKSYTARDVAEIRRSLVDLVPTLTSKWTDFNESDLGMVLIELIAGAQDMQNFYFDNQAFETYLDTAVQSKNIRSLLRNMNYRVPLVYSARGTLRITFADDSEKDITIPKYTRVFSSVYSTVQYSVLETVHASGEFSTLDIPIIEGEVHVLTMNRTDFENNVNSSGNVSRRIYLGFKNVSDGSVQVEQKDVIWKECDDALLQYDGGYYYSVHRDSEGQVYVLMSVDFMDLVPAATDEDVTFTFITSLGTSGLIEADVLDSIQISLENVTGISNENATYGAADDPDLFALKILARKNAVTMDRYITLGDYQTAVDKLPFVFQSLVKDWKYPDYVQVPYLVKVWAVDYSGHTLGSENIRTLEEKLYEKGNVEVTIDVQTVENVKFDIEADVVIKLSTYDEREKVRQMVEEEMVSLYGLNNMAFGRNISYSLMVSRILEVSPAIKDVYLKSPSRDVEVGAVQFPILGSVKVNAVNDLNG